MLFFADISEGLIKLIVFVIVFGLAKVGQLISSAVKRAVEKQKQQQAAMPSATARPDAPPTTTIDMSEAEEYPEYAEEEEDEEKQEIDLVETIFREIGLKKESFDVPVSPENAAFTEAALPPEPPAPSAPAPQNAPKSVSERKKPLLRPAVRKQLLTPGKLRNGIIVSEIIKRPRAYDI